MAEFVRFTLDDGSQVVFESAEGDLVALHGGEPDVREAAGSPSGCTRLPRPRRRSPAHCGRGWPQTR